MLAEKLYLEHSVKLRVAEPIDICSVYEFVDAYNDGMIIDRIRTKDSLREMVYNNCVLLAECRSILIGGIAGYIAPGVFTDDKIFSTMFFYIIKEYRHLTRRAVKEIELMLLTTKVTKIVFGVLANKNSEKQKRFMRMLGYSELESHMAKDIRYA